MQWRQFWQQVLSSISKSQEIIPTTIEYVDIAGLVKGASKGEGLGNKFLSNVRECDSIVQVHDLQIWLLLTQTDIYSSTSV